MISSYDPPTCATMSLMISVKNVLEIFPAVQLAITTLAFPLSSLSLRHILAEAESNFR